MNTYTVTRTDKSNYTTYEVKADCFVIEEGFVLFMRKEDNLITMAINSDFVMRVEIKENA